MSSKAWVFGDDIDTDVLAPGLYMKGGMDILASHCLEAVDPEFASKVRAGDIVVGGANFGIGSSREQAVQVLQMLGVNTIIAQSFAGIFFRNALNFGVTALTCADASKINAGDRITTDPTKGMVHNHTSGETYACDSLPKQLFTMVTAGGLVPHLEQKLATKDA
jgi:3-isopropylmalate/(R)-2-methylmalate dehydratase small subunit